MSDPHRLIDIAIDEMDLPALTPEMAQERRVAIFDLMEDNSFRLRDKSGPKGPYRLRLGIRERRLILSISSQDGDETKDIPLSLGPLREIIGDYFAICDSYADAVRRLPPSKIEEIDAGRKRIHDEAAEIVRDRLDEAAVIDLATARRLFTLISVLHLKG